MALISAVSKGHYPVKLLWKDGQLLEVGAALTITIAGIREKMAD
jgi:hypothetical protein